MHLRIEHEPADVLFGHARQLVTEDVLQTDEPDELLVGRLTTQAVVHHHELDDAFLLFASRAFVTRRL